MENRNVGFFIVGIAIVIGILVIVFNMALRDIVSTTCSHGPTCTMYDTVALQTWISASIAGLILLIGLFFIFAKENEKIIVKQKTITKPEKRKPINTSNLNKQEKEVIKLLQEEKGTVFQADLMEKLGIGKVGVTRLLDKLEAKQLIERKRRGMNNIVVLKN